MGNRFGRSTGCRTCVKRKVKCVSLIDSSMSHYVPNALLFDRSAAWKLRPSAAPCGPTERFPTHCHTVHLQCTPLCFSRFWSPSREMTDRATATGRRTPRLSTLQTRRLSLWRICRGNVHQHSQPGDEEGGLQVGKCLTVDISYARHQDVLSV